MTKAPVMFVRGIRNRCWGVAPGEFLRLLEQSEGDRLFNRTSYIFTIFHMVGPFADALQHIVATRRKCILATNQILGQRLLHLVF